MEPTETPTPTPTDTPFPSPTTIQYIDIKPDSALAQGISDYMYMNFVIYGVILFVLGFFMAVYVFKR